ncbi:MAG TPA: glycosyltransferase family 2 protein, partial [Chromatiaceae bacterium]|nr:glycosyltransferase family 2 protein [Chromatiaceae bacterium]
MAGISLCMIVKNEEENLPHSLESVKSLVDEMVIVDTGSSDRTLEIAEAYGAKIYTFKWRNDFSSARNFSIEHASCPWILILDADEQISPRDHDNIKDLIRNRGKEVFGFELIQRNYVYDSKINGIVLCRGEYPEEKDFLGFLPVPVIRLFRNDPRIRFKGP